MTMAMTMAMTMSMTRTMTRTMTERCHLDSGSNKAITTRRNKILAFHASKTVKDLIRQTRVNRKVNKTD
jgi:hypothetical protein